MITRHPSLKIGDLFQDQYRVERVLGSGGHAFVYAARDEIMGRDVALKLIEIPAESRDEQMRRARTEAQALRRLDHPNVVRVFSAGVTADGWIYIVMELLRGPSLRAVLRAHRTLAIAEALEIAIQIADAIHAAHQAKIIHRDLKPENIVLEAFNKVIIIDFGVAKLVDPDAQTTQRDLIQGTIDYLSPEQLRGQPASPQSDMFALGVVLYEMLAGIRPAQVGLTEINVDVIVYRQLYENPREIYTLREDVPVFVDRVVQRMLDKDPARRFPGMNEAAKALRNVLTRLSAGGRDAAPSPVRDLSRVVPQASPKRDGAVLATVSAEPRTLVQTTRRLALVQVPPEALPSRAVPVPQTPDHSPQQSAPNIDAELQVSRVASMVQRVSTISFDSATPAPAASSVPEPVSAAEPMATAISERAVAWWDLSSVANHPLFGRSLVAAAIAGTVVGMLSGMLSPVAAASPRHGLAAARVVMTVEPTGASSPASEPLAESFQVTGAAESAPIETTSAPTAVHLGPSPAVTNAAAPRRLKPRLPKPAASASAAPVASAPEPKSWIRVRGDDGWLPSSGLSDVVPIPARPVPAASSARPRRVLIPAKP